jgi:hypothetical protein
VLGAALLLRAIGAGLAWYAPIASARCVRAPDQTASCAVTGSLLGIVPLWTARLDDVTAVRRDVRDIPPGGCPATSASAAGSSRGTRRSRS